MARMKPRDSASEQTDEDSKGFPTTLKSQMKNGAGR